MPTGKRSEIAEEAGGTRRRKTKKADEAQRPPEGFVWKSLPMAAPDGTEWLIDGWGPPDDPPTDPEE